MFYKLKKQRAAAPLPSTNLYTHLGAKRCHRHQTMVASHFNGWVIDDGGKKRAFRYATLARRCRVPKGTPIADNRRYQPLKRLATSVKPLRGKAALPFAEMCIKSSPFKGRGAAAHNLAN